MAKIKARWVGMVTMNFEVDENEPGVYPLEKINGNVKGLNKAIREVLESEIGGTFSVEQQYCDVWRANDD